MPTEKTLAKRATLAEVANQIDEIASSVQLYEATDGGLARQLAVAQAVVDMRALLTDEVMAPVMALMNTGLGFKSDQDPRRPSRNNPNPKAYGVDTVREVVIEAKLRGFNLVGQEFNIISGGFYACKAGLQRKLRDGKIKGLTKFRDFYDLPKISADGTSGTVKCRATWELNGKADKAEFEFFIKLHGMGPDAALGKAERRLAKEILKFVTGDAPPDGEVDEIRRDALPEPELRMKPAQGTDETVPAKPEEKDEIPMGPTNIAPADPTPTPPTPTPQTAPTPTPIPTTPAAPAIVPRDKGNGFITALRGRNIAPVDALATIRRMFPETSATARTIEEVVEHHPNIMNALRRAWDDFVRFCGESAVMREEAEKTDAAKGEDQIPAGFKF